MIRVPPHPTGTIVYYDGNTGTIVDETPIEQVPEQMRYIYRKDGVTAANPTEADEAVPVVAVYRFTTDDNNNFVPPERATRAYIEERDPAGRTVRRTRQLRMT